jgi:hypothetical protein
MNYENLDESCLKSIVNNMDSQQLLKILNQTLNITSLLETSDLNIYSSPIIVI